MTDWDNGFQAGWKAQKQHIKDNLVIILYNYGEPDFNGENHITRVHYKQLEEHIIKELFGDEK